MTIHIVYTLYNRAPYISAIPLRFVHTDTSLRSRSTFNLHPRTHSTWQRRRRRSRHHTTLTRRRLHHLRDLLCSRFPKAPGDVLARRHTQEPFTAHTLQRLRSASHIATQIATPHKAAANHASQDTERACVAVRNPCFRISVARDGVGNGAGFSGRFQRREVCFFVCILFAGFGGCG